MYTYTRLKYTMFDGTSNFINSSEANNDKMSNQISHSLETFIIHVTSVILNEFYTVTGYLPYIYKYMYIYIWLCPN